MSEINLIESPITGPDFSRIDWLQGLPEDGELRTKLPSVFGRQCHGQIPPLTAKGWVLLMFAGEHEG